MTKLFVKITGACIYLFDVYCLSYRLIFFAFNIIHTVIRTIYEKNILIFNAHGSWCTDE